MFLFIHCKLIFQKAEGHGNSENYPDEVQLEQLGKAEAEDVMNELDKLVQKLSMIVAVIFELIDVKGESGSKQQQQCYFCYHHFFDSGWTSCGSLLLFYNTIVKC